ncbi:MAG TPA: sigma-70 family RNA polymerase sigma factor [Planctomycetaceae bacterium]|nr:sigma-70 family RNA polymerase sigma factor [Planctomycetaceae bacterium]
MPLPHDNLTDQQLVQALNDGHNEAFDALYFRHRDWAMRLAERFTGHHDDALDVLQETFAYFARKFPGFELTAALPTFLYPAVRNFSIAARRKRLRSVSADGDVASLTAEPGSAEISNRDEFTQTLASLSDDHREILMMRFVDDMTQPEIAAALSIPLGTVKSRLHHAVLAVKQSPETLERLDGVKEV